MKLTQGQLRSLIKEAFSDADSPMRPLEATPALDVSEDDADNARNAEYGLDMLHTFFDTPELQAAKTLVMQRLFDLQKVTRAPEDIPDED